jgi:hypothetical protein
LPKGDRRVEAKPLFLFFSNRLGCAGSLLVSAVVTLILLVAFGLIEFD